MIIEEKYMRRALQLAANGAGTTGSNPMVGAVIVGPDGRIIGEGWHRRYGQGHAEVKAVESVRMEDAGLLSRSTIYVTLEPCSHYGKTPPCAKLINDCGIRSVVVGAVDPFEKVSGRGVEMLKSNGCDVAVGVLADECRRLNAKFFTAHTRRRPFVLLKWAQTSDRCIGVRGRRLQISNEASAMEVHRLRSRYGAIMAGAGTVVNDDPMLDVRLWSMGDAPRRAVADRRHVVPVSSRFFRNDKLCDAVYFCGAEIRAGLPAGLLQLQARDVAGMLDALYGLGVTSLMVEGGAGLLNEFVESGLWDAARVETNPYLQVDESGAVYAPVLPCGLEYSEDLDGNIIQIFTNNPLVDVKNL